MRYLITFYIAFALGYAAHMQLQEDPVTRLEGAEQWCFHSRYESLAKYRETAWPPFHFVDIEGTSVRIFVPCEVLRR
jgi:hypothetical protein